MKLERIRLKNFKTFQNAEMSNIPAFCIIVGANGSGKTSFFDVFGFLKDCLLSNVSKAVRNRGGYHELVSRGHDGESIQIELKYRTEINNRNRLVTYILELGVNEHNKICVIHEILRYKRGPSGSPFHFLDYSYGKGDAIVNEDDFDKVDEKLQKENHDLESPDILAIKGLGQFKKFKAANELREFIENWHVSDFHINQARGLKENNGNDEHLSETGDNLQLVAKYIQDNHPDVFQKILDRMCACVPGVSKIETENTSDNRLLLKFHNGKFIDPFIDRYVSDGTIKMFAYLILLHDPVPHPFLCIEEPENQLYPSLLIELAEEFRNYAHRGGQVFVSTHSPDFLNDAELDEVFWLEKMDSGFTTISRAANDEQIAIYMREGDKMGYLWKQGFFTGVDP